jgi:hypothetical protein
MITIRYLKLYVDGSGRCLEIFFGEGFSIFTTTYFKHNRSKGGGEESP